MSTQKKKTKVVIPPYVPSSKLTQRGKTQLVGFGPGPFIKGSKRLKDTQKAVTSMCLSETINPEK